MGDGVRKYEAKTAAPGSLRLPRFHDGVHVDAPEGFRAWMSADTSRM